MDQELKATVTRALAGDHEAFTLLIRRYARLLYAQAYAILGSHADSEDTVQEALVRAYQFRATLKDPERFPGWLLAITRNLARDLLRRRRARFVPAEAPPPEVADEAPAPGLALEQEEQNARVLVALSRLPARHRTAVVMRYLQGFEHRHIEATLGISNGTLRGLLGRGLARLRRALSAGPPP